MIKLLKKHFIPHEANDHRPYFLRRESIRNLLILIICCELTTFVLPLVSNSTGWSQKNSQLATVLPAILATLTNQERQAQKLQPLATDPALTQAAELKAQDMAKNGYFAHTSPTGLTPWYWLETVGYKYQYAGENLAINFNDSKDVTQAWMNSPTHKANIIKDKYTHIGTGIATGLYRGKTAVFVAQVYARPLTPTQGAKTVTHVSANTLGGKINTVEQKVLGAESEITELPVDGPIQSTDTDITWWNILSSSPRNTTQTILSFLFCIVSLALILNSVIRIKKHHRDLAIGGLLVLSVIGLLLILNSYISSTKMHVLESIEYSQPDTNL